MVWIREAVDPWTCLFTAFVHYMIFVLVDYLVKIGLSFARNDNQRRRLWRYEALLIGALALVVFLITGSVPFILITLGCATYLSSRGQTLVQGVVMVLTFLQDLLEEILLWIYYKWQPAVNEDPAYIDGRYQPAIESRSVDGASIDDASMLQSPRTPVAFDHSALNHCLQNNKLLGEPQEYATHSVNCHGVGGQKMLSIPQDCTNRGFQNHDPRMDANVRCRVSVSSERTFSGRIMGFLSSNIPGLGKRPRGLYNNGRNLCFMNSVLQCLARTPYFPSELSSAILTTEGLINVSARVERPVAKAVANLFMELMVPDGITISQNRFRCYASRLNVNLIAPPESDCRQSQQDAAEFIMWLLATIHTAVNVPNNRMPLRVLPNVNPLQLLDNLVSSNHDYKQALQTMREEYLDQIKNANTLDGQELLIPLQSLSELEWWVYNLSNQSLIDKMFTGQLADLHQCLACNRISVHITTFTVLPVAVPSVSHCTLDDCITQFHRIEPLEGANGLKCECLNPLPRNAQSPNSNDSGYVSMDSKKSLAAILSKVNLSDGRKRTILCRLPECLIIQLMRFRYDRVRRQCSKVYTPVMINPDCLDMTHYALHTGFINQENAYGFAYRYQLYGLCLHQGGDNTSYGHYVAYAPDIDGHWHHLEDEEVNREKDITSVLRMRPVQENAYILFYFLKR